MVRSLLPRIVPALLILSFATTGLAQPALVSHPISNPTIINLYWDANWDSTHPAMTRRMIDEYTKALVGSTYFAGLAEYSGSLAQTGVTFAGGFSVVGCPGHTIGPWSRGGLEPTAPSTISEVDIGKIVQCQIDAGQQPHGPNVIFNVFVPETTVERPWWFCRPHGYSAYHLHSGAQTFVAIFARHACLRPQEGLFGLTGNLTHELVEAITNPNVHVVQGPLDAEIADKCNPRTFMFLMMGGGSVSDYWSNAANGCLQTGVFGDTTVPSITGVSVHPHSASLNDLTMTISGTGFGSLPPAFASLPAITNLPYLSLTDESTSPQWTAGNSLPRNDSVTLAFRSWSPTTIVIDGFSGSYGSGGMQAHPGDDLFVIVCNPQSGQCSNPDSTIEGVVPLPPTVTGLVPSSGPAQGGTSVNVHGTGFTSTSDTVVYFGDERVDQAHTTVINSSALTASAPVSAPGQSVGVRVINSNGMSTTSPAYNYCGPVITAIAPGSGGTSGGTAIVITGSCLTGVSEVDFGGLPGTNLVVNSDTQISVTSPPATCIDAPASGTFFIVGVNAFEQDPRSIVVGEAGAWSQDSMAARFLYTGSFPLQGCTLPLGQILSPCLQHPLKCFAIELRPDFVLQAGRVGTAKDPFQDLHDFAWAEPSIVRVAAEGLLPGVTATAFAPDRPVTRAEFVMAVAPLFRVQPSAHPLRFSDVKEGTVELAAAQSLSRALDLYRDRSGQIAFHPDQVLDRQNAAAAVVNLAAASGRLRMLSDADAASSLGKLGDSKDIAPALRTHVANAITAGFFYVPNKDFAPAAPLTRAQLAMILDRLQTVSGK